MHCVLLHAGSRALIDRGCDRRIRSTDAYQSFEAGPAYYFKQQYGQKLWQRYGYEHALRDDLERARTLRYTQTTQSCLDWRKHRMSTRILGPTATQSRNYFSRLRRDRNFGRDAKTGPSHCLPAKAGSHVIVDTLGSPRHDRATPQEVTMLVRVRLTLALTAIALATALPCFAQDDTPETTTGRTMRPTIMGRQYAVSSMKQEATEAAVRILEAGGNAFDAVVAGQAVLALVDPASQRLRRRRGRAGLRRARRRK